MPVHQDTTHKKDGLRSRLVRSLNTTPTSNTAVTRMPIRSRLTAFATAAMFIAALVVGGFAGDAVERAADGETAISRSLSATPAAAHNGARHFSFRHRSGAFGMDVGNHTDYTITVHTARTGSGGFKVQTRFVDVRKFLTDVETSWSTRKVCKFSNGTCVARGTMGTRWDRIEVRLVAVQGGKTLHQGSYHVSAWD